MNCKEATERILDSLSGFPPVGTVSDRDAHLSGCPMCRTVLETHLALDRQLNTILSVPALRKEFRSDLLEAVSREPLSNWPAFLPDLAHAIGCVVATTVCIILLPIPIGMGSLIALAVALAAYFIQSLFQEFLETWEEDQV